MAQMTTRRPVIRGTCRGCGSPIWRYHHGRVWYAGQHRPGAAALRRPAAICPATGDGKHRARRSYRRPRMNAAKAARLVAAMEAIRRCEDFPAGLSAPFEDVRRAISPYYDTQED